MQRKVDIFLQVFYRAGSHDSQLLLELAKVVKLTWDQMVLPKTNSNLIFFLKLCLVKIVKAFSLKNLPS